MQINTTAENCRLRVKIKRDNHTQVELSDTDEKTVMLEADVTYSFEWHVLTTADDAHMRIQATFDPPNDGFPPLDNDRDAARLPPPGGEDDGIFIFTLNAQ